MLSHPQLFSHPHPLLQNKSKRIIQKQFEKDPQSHPLEQEDWQFVAAKSLIGDSSIYFYGLYYAGREKCFQKLCRLLSEEDFAVFPWLCRNFHERFTLKIIHFWFF